MTPAVKAILFANVGVFLLGFVLKGFADSDLIADVFGLSPQALLERAHLWQLVTYLFVHDATGFGHILFNMLALWMFGVDLERRWGTRGFVRYYAITGIGAGVVTAVVSLLPFEVTRSIYTATTIGASGAIYGLLLAWALLFPHRHILFMFIFPLPARTAPTGRDVVSRRRQRRMDRRQATHLADWSSADLPQRPREPAPDISYAAKWRNGADARKFNVHQGGRKGNGDGRRINRASAV
jgi:membrane associated rhomboid family serine protease